MLTMAQLINMLLAIDKANTNIHYKLYYCRHLIMVTSILAMSAIRIHRHSCDHIFIVLNYCILIAKFHIYCQWIHNNNAINLFQYLIELKTS